jgi:hypothetical protein
MGVFHQMGHDSENLVREVGGYEGVVLSPLNSTEDRVRGLIAGHANSGLEFVFDPQMYFPRTEREKLRAWPYFPNDVDTADLGDITWWSSLNKQLVKTCRGLGATTVCSPTIVPHAFQLDYYSLSIEIAADLARAASDLEVLQTLVVPIAEIASFQKVMEIASIASATKSNRIYIIFLVNQEPRREIAESQWLTGALRLITELKNAGMSTLVGCCGPEAILYTAAGATSCATGKFFNLRRFTPGRFDEPSRGGGQLAYWFEESFLAYLREPDLVRVRRLGLLSEASESNPFGKAILAQLDKEPGKAWLGTSWRHYIYWFADVDQRLRNGEVKTEDLLMTAERSWEIAEDKGLLMEEQRNDGRWVRPWRIALRSYSRDF